MSWGYYGSTDRKLLQEIEEELDLLNGQIKTSLLYQKDSLEEQKKTNDFLDQIQKALEISADFQEQILAAILALNRPVTLPAVALKFSFGTPVRK